MWCTAAGVCTWWCFRQTTQPSAATAAIQRDSSAVGGIFFGFRVDRFARGAGALLVAAGFGLNPLRTIWLVPRFIGLVRERVISVFSRFLLAEQGGQMLLQRRAEQLRFRRT